MRLALGRVAAGRFRLARFGDERFPLLDSFRRAAVQLEPGERFTKYAAVDERASSARACREIAEPPLEAEHLT